MPGLSLSLGLGLSARGSSGPYIARTASSFPEDTASGTTVATLSVANHPSGPTGWTFAETADPDNKFNSTITAGALKTNATVNYETATSHSVTITASKSGQTDIVNVLTFQVTNVFEAASLSALALDDTDVPTGSPATINITGATSGSTITLLSGSLPPGMSLNSGARTIAGTP